MLGVSHTLYLSTNSLSTPFKSERFVQFMFCFFNARPLYSQNVDFKTGIIIDSVVVKNSKESFALYLPKKFDKNEQVGK